MTCGRRSAPDEGSTLNTRDEVVTGTFVLLGVALVVVGALWLSESRWRGDYREVSAFFDNVGQLRPGNPVTLRGVEVGRVRSVEVRGDGVLVHFRVESDVPLPERPVVSLQPVSMFGGWSAAIRPASATDLALDTVPRPEDALPGVTSSDFADLSDYAGEIAANLGRITDRVEVAFNEQTAAELARAVSNFEDASQELVTLLGRQRESFGGFAEDMESAGRNIRQVAAALDSTVSRLETATQEGELEAIFDNTRDATASLSRVSGRLETTSARLDRTILRADSVLAVADSLLSDMERGEGTLGRLASDPALYEDLSATLTELRSLLDDLKSNPGKYFKFSIF